MVCHTRAANYVLGLNTAQMNRDHDYGGKTDNQLRTLAHIGVLKVPGQSNAVHGELPKLASEYQKLVDPADESQPLEARVRAYLHANCAHCHTDAGGGNSKLELSAKTPLDKMALVDALPQHDSFKLPDARLVAPAAPERSLLLYRLAKRGAGQMPPLGTNVVDEVGTDLLRAWIERLRP